jgi:hypothetical protein
MIKLRFEALARLPLRIECESWVARIGRAPLAREILRTLLREAPRAIRTALELGGQNGVDFPHVSTLMIGIKKG